MMCIYLIDNCIIYFLYYIVYAFLFLPYLFTSVLPITFLVVVYFSLHFLVVPEMSSPVWMGLWRRANPECWPYHRGASPGEWVDWNWENKSSFTLIFMVFTAEWSQTKESSSFIWVYTGLAAPLVILLLCNTITKESYAYRGCSMYICSWISELLFILLIG